MFVQDCEIVELYLKRDERAIAESNTHYGAYCRRIADNILHCREDTDECVNDTWHRAWLNIPPTIPKSLAAFFGKIVRNLSLSRYRKSKAAKRSSESGGITLLLSDFEDCVPSADTVHKSVENKAITETIDDWLANLPKEERVLFVKRYWFGEAVKDLAAECGMTANQTAQRMMNLRASLKAKLEQEGIEV
jgi:RNA polymerase sigma-70 factor (ECF subfamily)